MARGRWSRLRAYLRARPVLCLVLLSPVIPEYLSGSSQMSLIFYPPIFVAILLVNLAIYPPAVLLVREARIRWGKGWGSVLLLGMAYGVVNEGLCAATFFNPAGQGAVALYGRWLGVSWLSTSGLVLIVHPLVSISLPLILLELGLPETRGRSLLGRRGIATAFGILAIGVVGATEFREFITHFVETPFDVVGCLIAIAALVYAAYRFPRDLITPTHPRPSASPLLFFVAAVGFAWGTFFVEALLAQFDPPIFVAVLLLAAWAVLFLRWVLTHIGRSDRARPLVAGCAGVAVALISMGIASQLHTGVGLVPVLAVDGVAVGFLVFLWRKYAPAPEPPGPGRTRGPEGMPG